MMNSKNLGDMLLRRYVVDFIAQMQKNQSPIVRSEPPKLLFSYHPWYVTDFSVYHLHEDNLLYICQTGLKKRKCFECRKSMPKDINTLAFTLGLRSIEGNVTPNGIKIKGIND